MGRDFQCIIGEETKQQLLEAEGQLPDTLVACIGGGSNAIGLFHPFLDDDVEIIGVSSYPSKGLQRGIVLNIDSTVESIRKAIEDAEKMAGTEITSVIVGIAGGHIRSLNGHGMITLRNREVTKRDLDRVIESATAGAQPADREVIHFMSE